MGKRKDRKKMMKKIQETLSVAQQKGVIDGNGFVKVDNLGDRRTVEIMAREPRSPDDIAQSGAGETDEEFSVRKAAIEKAHREWKKDLADNDRRIAEEASGQPPIHVQQIRRAFNKDPLTGESLHSKVESINQPDNGEDS